MLTFTVKPLSSSPSRHVTSCTLPVLYPSPIRPLPIPYLSPTCLASLSLIKGRGQTLYLISDHPPPTTTTTKLFLASGVSIPIPCCSLSHTIPYLSLAHPLPIPYSSLTCLLPIPYPSPTSLASLGLIKGWGQTLYLISDTTHPTIPPTNLLPIQTSSSSQN